MVAGRRRSGESGLAAWCAEKRDNEEVRYGRTEYLGQHLGPVACGLWAAGLTRLRETEGVTEIGRAHV